MSDIDRLSGGSSPGAGDILQLLLDGHARTKADLVHLTGLARSTVSARVDALLASGLVIPAGEGASTGGRPPSRLAFNPRAGAVLAADLGASHATVAVADLSGRILAVATEEIDIAAGPHAVLDLAIAKGRRLLESTEVSDLRLVGVGVGLPGPVEHSTGRPYNPPIMPGWDRFDVPDYVQGTFNVPVLVDNDVNILALGEHATSFPDTADLVFVKVATGIGAGVIAGGQLQRGAQGSAGDMGHVRVPYSPDSSHEPGEERDLEALASGSAIARVLREHGLDAQNSSDVVALVRGGNLTAIEATRQAGRDVGEVLATVVNLLNPSIIVLGGSIARAGEHLLAGVREVVYRRSIPLATQHLAIVQTQAGERAGVLGAAIMVARHVLAPANVDSFISTASATARQGGGREPAPHPTGEKEPTIPKRSLGSSGAATRSISLS
ncbi:ROK family transcriptional regulator [Microbacterium sp.]|uniref:ROK family transcriptional regulator n=1 Tax=Microbacterium sp. TaxID=51671 RepID=UPI0026328882|nr:ROK family transcriptional regulator [Microbacterium sp.]